MSEQLNDGLKPLCGIVVCCTSIPSEIKTDLALKASKLGAIYTQDLTSQVTHLIAGKLNTMKYKYVAMHRVDMKIMHVGWIFDIYEQWLNGDDIDFLEFEKKHILPPFYNLLICVTNIPAEQRSEIEEKITCFGGKYTPDLTKDTTHLIATDASGRKYEFGIKWGIKVIRPEWFWQSIERGACLEEHFFSLDMAPEELGKGSWFPMQENEKDEDQQMFVKKKIKKIKLDLSQVWNNIVNENHKYENDLPKKIDNLTPINMIQDTENNELNGMFFGLYFYAWAFDSRKTKILENIIKSHDGLWCKTIHDFPDTSIHIYIIVSHDLPKFKFPDISKGCFVTEWWIERCLHNKKFIEPSEHLLCRPLLCSFPLEGMQDLSICLTGFSGVDLLHISKLIVLLGSKYYESLNNKRNLLIYNSKSKKSRKYIKAKDWNIKIVTEDWLWEIIKQGRLIDLNEWEKKNQVKEINNSSNSTPKTLTKVTLYFHNIKESYMNEIFLLAEKLGIRISTELNDSVTHVISDEPLLNINQKTNMTDAKYKIISSKWLLACQNQLKFGDFDFHNILDSNETPKNFDCGNLSMQRKHETQITNINYPIDLLKKDVVLEKRKIKEKIKGRSTSLSIISTNIPIINYMSKNSPEVFNDDKQNKSIQSEYVKYQDIDALCEKKQLLEKLSKI
ncbi:unnamed protein product [Pneumocystis jirovecii]|uniref:BRCT domain-containing protein n=1 Tax=Pneumocystis jirovecii TaxID=42068 RepID=L0PEZ6_PNEJI|nr:unnamed protein product [Pneumocystis jirovecii]